MKKGFISCCFYLLFICAVTAQNTIVTISADKKGAPIAPGMWGLFFEDINFAADGGIYAEMIKNRSFEFNTPFMGWRRIMGRIPRGRADVVNTGNANNARYVQIVN